MNKFSIRLEEAMHARKMTASKLSQKTGIPKSSISQYINGYANPKADRIYLMAKALEVSEAWLLGYDVPPQSGQIPLVSLVLCDEEEYPGSLLMDYVTEYITLPTRMIDPNLSYFAMFAWEDLTGEGITAGDVLIFEKTLALENGQMGCFCVGMRTVVGIYYKLDNGLILIESADESEDPIVVDVTNICFTIVGKYACKITV